MFKNLFKLTPYGINSPFKRFIIYKTNQEQLLAQEIARKEQDRKELLERAYSYIKNTIGSAYPSNFTTKQEHQNAFNAITKAALILARYPKFAIDALSFFKKLISEKYTAYHEVVETIIDLSIKHRLQLHETLNIVILAQVIAAKASLNRWLQKKILSELEYNTNLINCNLKYFESILKKSLWFHTINNKFPLVFKKFFVKLVIFLNKGKISLDKLNHYLTVNAIDAINEEARLKKKIDDSKWARLINQAIEGVSDSSKKWAAVFFNMKTTSYDLLHVFGKPMLISSQILEETAAIFWLEVVTPEAIKKSLSAITVQLRFKTDAGEWRNVGHYTTWNITDIQGFIKFLTLLLNSSLNHYAAAGILVTQIDFSWKLLTDNDSALNLRTHDMHQKSVLNSAKFNRIANAIPLTADYQNIEGAV